MLINALIDDSVVDPRFLEILQLENIVQLQCVFDKQILYSVHLFNFF